MYVLIWAWQFFQFYALFLVLVAVHEAGHHLAGALVGYRWKGWTVGPLRVSREDGAVRVRLSKTLLGGRAIAFHPPDDTLARQSVYILGGPVASLLFGLGILFYFHHLPPVQQDATWQVMATVYMSFWLVLGSIVPYSRKGFKNDAALLVHIWRNKAEWDDYHEKRKNWADYSANRERYEAEYELENARHTALMTLVASMQDGQRPSEWDAGLMEQAVALRDGKPNEAAAVHYGFYWAADRGDWERGGEYIRRALALRETLPGPWRAKVLLDGAYHEGLVQNDAAVARLLLTEASRDRGRKRRRSSNAPMYDVAG